MNNLVCNHLPCTEDSSTTFQNDLHGGFSSSTLRKQTIAHGLAHGMTDLHPSWWNVEFQLSDNGPPTLAVGWSYSRPGWNTTLWWITLCYLTEIQVRELYVIRFLGDGFKHFNILYVHPYLGKSSNLTNIFQMGWNHQLDVYNILTVVFICVGVQWNLLKYALKLWPKFRSEAFLG